VKTGMQLDVEKFNPKEGQLANHRQALTNFPTVVAMTTCISQGEPLGICARTRHYPRIGAT
jgi:hypothetical protein